MQKKKEWTETTQTEVSEPEINLEYEVQEEATTLARSGKNNLDKQRRGSEQGFVASLGNNPTMVGLYVLLIVLGLFIGRWLYALNQAGQEVAVPAATATSSETPPTVPINNNIAQPLYMRRFNGMYIYVLQNLGHLKHQIGIKYDFYDPNTDIKAAQIGAENSNFTAADIKYSTLGIGYLWYINENFRLMLWYDHVENEITSLNNYTSDLKDDVFTCRAQYRF